MTRPGSAARPAGLLRAAARHGAHARRDQPLQTLPVGEVRQAAEEGDLHGGEGLQVDGRVGGAQGAQEVDVVVEPRLRDHAADDVELGDPRLFRPVRRCQDLVAGQEVGVGCAQIAAKAAERAAVDAGVGRVDVAVDVEEHVGAIAPPVHPVGQPPDRVQVR